MAEVEGLLLLDWAHWRVGFVLLRRPLCVAGDGHRVFVGFERTRL